MRNQPAVGAAVQARRRSSSKSLGRFDLRVDRRHRVGAVGVPGRDLSSLAAQRLVGDRELDHQPQAAPPGALEPLVVDLLVRRAAPGRPAVEQRRAEVRSRAAPDEKAVDEAVRPEAGLHGPGAEEMVDEVLAVEEEEVVIGAVGVEQRIADAGIELESRSRREVWTPSGSSSGR